MVFKKGFSKHEGLHLSSLLAPLVLVPGTLSRPCESRCRILLHSPNASPPSGLYSLRHLESVTIRPLCMLWESKSILKEAYNYIHRNNRKFSQEKLGKMPCISFHCTEFHGLFLENHNVSLGKIKQS